MGDDGGRLTPEDLEALLASVAHEVGTPLAVIDSAVDLLDRVRDDPERFEQIVAALRRNVALLELVMGRLRHARRSSDEPTPVCVPTDLVELARTTVADLQPNVLKRHPTEVEAPDELVVSVDGVLLRELLYNLLSNAAKFSPADRLVSVALRREGDDALLIVEDQGSGVAPEDEEIIFERFGRADDSPPGLGVGLYLARQIARAHGGDLVLDPVEDGGARFVTHLPL